MKNIEEYIRDSYHMNNTSDGGSNAYFFNDGYVLVKYEMNASYGIARPEEEVVATKANELYKKGVNTPMHVAIKRETIKDKNICWVLQTKAPGISLINYTTDINDSKQQLVMQQKLLDLPGEIYQKYFLDLLELYYLGIELKPKNIYLDEEKGFTIIDLLGKFDYKKIDFTQVLYATLECIRSSLAYTTIYSYKESTVEQRIESNILYKKLMLKVLQNIEVALNKIDNFDIYKRWLIRAFNEDEIKFFGENGYEFSNLTLNPNEEQIFDDLIDIGALKLIDMIANNERELWQIESNEARFFVQSYLLGNAWKYKKNNGLKKNVFEEEVYYDNASEVEVEEILLNRFVDKILSMETNNPYIIKAQEEINQMKNERTK